CRHARADRRAGEQSSGRAQGSYAADARCRRSQGCRGEEQDRSIPSPQRVRIHRRRQALELTQIRMRESGGPRGSAGRAGVLLHGRERTKAEMTDLAARFDLPGIRWLAPAADTGKWYPGRYMDTLASNEPNLTRAVERCDKVVDEASEGGRLAPDR